MGTLISKYTGWYFHKNFLGNSLNFILESCWNIRLLRCFSSVKIICFCFCFFFLFFFNISSYVSGPKEKQWLTLLLLFIITKFSLRQPAALLKKLWYKYFPVNFEKFLRAPILQDSSGGCVWKILRLRLTDEQRCIYDPVRDQVFLQKYLQAKSCPLFSQENFILRWAGSLIRL